MEVERVASFLGDLVVAEDTYDDFFDDGPLLVHSWSMSGSKSRARMEWLQEYLDKVDEGDENDQEADAVAKGSSSEEDLELPVDGVIRESGPQGNVKPFTIIQDPSAWKASDWVGRENEFKLVLTDSDNAAIEATVADIKTTGKRLEDLKYPKDFPLPEDLANRLAEMKENLISGRGFAILKGLPVQRWSEWQSVAAYVGIGAHLGYRQPQSKDGKLINHVKMYHTPGQTNAPVREHAHNLDFSWHTDAQADLLGLLCINQAKEGGVSGWASTIAVHNELLRRGRADLVKCLTGSGWFRDRARYQDLQPGESPLWEAPVFCYHDGRLTVHFSPAHYKVCMERYPDMFGGLTELQVEAIDMFSEIASDPAFELKYRMEPGDAAFLNNSAVLHSRSAFKDGDEPHERRHLVRLWLAVQEGLDMPAHLDYPRSYSKFYDREKFVGLMKPDPACFHVPMSEASDAV